MCDVRRFQADDAATEKELLESWRLNRGTIKSPRDVDRVHQSRNDRLNAVQLLFAGTFIPEMT